MSGNLATDPAGSEGPQLVRGNFITGCSEGILEKISRQSGFLLGYQLKKSLLKSVKDVEPRENSFPLQLEFKGTALPRDPPSPSLASSSWLGAKVSGCPPHATFHVQQRGRRKEKKIKGRAT